MSVTKEFQFFHKRKYLPADLEQDGGMESDPSPLPIFPLREENPPAQAGNVSMEEKEI